MGNPTLIPPLVQKQPYAAPVSSVGAKYAKPERIKQRSEKVVKLAVIRSRNNRA